MQLLDLQPHEIDEVGEKALEGWVGAGRALRVPVGGGLLGAGHRHLRGAGRASPQVGELLGTHIPSPAEPVDHGRAAEGHLTTFLIAEGHRHAARAVEPLERLQEMAEERETALLAVGKDIEPRLLLEPDRLIDRAVLDTLELGRAQLASVEALTRLLQVLRPEQAPDYVAPVYHDAPPQNRGRRYRFSGHSHCIHAAS